MINKRTLRRDNEPYRSLFGSAGLRIANVGLNFAVALVLARTLGADGYGSYSIALVVASFCAIFVQFGLPNVVMRETAGSIVSEDWAGMRAVWRWALRWLAVSSLSVLVAGAALLLLLHNRIEAEAFWMYSLALCLVPLMGLNAVRAGALRGLNYVVLAQIPEMLAKPAVMLLLCFTLGLLLPAAASTAMVMQLFAVGIACVLGSVFLHQRRPVKLSKSKLINEGSTSGLWRVVLAMGLSSAMNQVNNYSDILMLGAFCPTEQVGIYRIAYQISTLCAFGLQIVSAVYSPLYARLYRQDNFDQLQIILARGAFISVGISVLLALPWLLYGDLLINSLFGPQFVSGWGPLLLLIAAQIVNSSFGPIGMLMNMTGLEKYVVRFMLFAAVTNCFLNLLLVPVYGAMGAAAATLITLAVWNVGLWWMARRHLNLNGSFMAIFTRLRR